MWEHPNDTTPLAAEDQDVPSIASVHQDAPPDASVGQDAPPDASVGQDAPPDASVGQDAPPDASVGQDAPPGAPDMPPAPAPDTVADEGARKPQRGRPRIRLEELEAGRVFRGKVVGLAKFGAFVDIGAVTDGLVHLTEFGGKRARKPEEALALGEEVEVWVKDVDLSGNRISLSMRKKPQNAIRDLRAGDVLTGVVTSTTDYGVFVDIGSETEGLVHISEISSGFVQKPSDVVKAGDAVEVRVKDVDLGRERISLSMVGLASDTGGEVGGAEAREPADGSAQDADGPEEGEERRPTVVELALRRALGDADDEGGSEDEPGEPKTPERRGERQQSLGEIYERMLAEYRSSRAED